MSVVRSTRAAVLPCPSTIAILLPLAALFVLLCSSGMAASELAAPPMPGSSRSVTGTVRSVDVQARSLEVITGVGLALRTVRISCDDATAYKGPAGAMSLAGIKQGDVVRIDTRAPEGNVARTVELLPPPGARGVR